MRLAAFLGLAVGLGSLAGCASSGSANMSTVAPNPDPRVGLKPGLFNAGEATWNLRVLSQTPPPEKFAGVTNSDPLSSASTRFRGTTTAFRSGTSRTPLSRL